MTLSIDAEKAFDKFNSRDKNSFFFFFFFFFFFSIFWAAPLAFGGSQARGLIRAVAASLC